MIDAIEVFRSLNRWMEERMQWDELITPELMRTFNTYQELYVNSQIKK